jgi:hypothetical protein
MMMNRSHRVGAVALVLLALACGKSEKKSPSKGKEPTAEAKADKPAEAKAEEAPLKLDAFWESSSYIRITDQKPCPDGFWALFGGEPPGDTKEEKKANLAKKAELKKSFEGKTFYVWFQGPEEISLGEYQNAKGEFPVQVKATVLCKAPMPLNNVAIAIGPVIPRFPEGREDGQYYWLGEPVPFPVKVPFAQTAEFKNKHRFDWDVRVLFTPGKVEQHKKIIKSTETEEEKAERKKHDIPGRAGGMEDWGAGWVLHAEVKAVRVATERGRTEQFVRK